jgi:hypothetical protein
VRRMTGLVDAARCDIGCHIILETRVQLRVIDVSSNIHQALLSGRILAAPGCTMARDFTHFLKQFLRRFSDLEPEIRAQMSTWVRPGGYCSPRHPTHCGPSSDASGTIQSWSLVDIARRFIQRTRNPCMLRYMTIYDVASNPCLALAVGRVVPAPQRRGRRVGGGGGGWALPAPPAGLRGGAWYIHILNVHPRSICTSHSTFPSVYVSPGRA